MEIESISCASEQIEAKAGDRGAFCPARSRTPLTKARRACGARDAGLITPEDSTGPLRIELTLHIGFLIMRSVTGWVSENAPHQKPSFREELF